MNTTTTTTTTTTLALGRPSPITRRPPLDWAFAALVVAGTAYAFSR